MSITVTPQPTNTPPRMQISVAGYSSATSISIFRNDPDGVSRLIRSAGSAALTSGAGVFFDYEPPFSQPVTYTTSPNAGSSETSPVATITSTQTWLIHPSTPDLSVPVAAVDMLGFEERTRAARASVQQPLGRRTPIVVSDTRASTQSVMRFRTDSTDQRNRVWALLEYGFTLLLNVPEPVWAVPAEYISVGDVTETQENGGLSTGRIFTLPYTVVDPPVGNVATQWTYGGFITSYSSYQDVLAAYGSYTALLAQTV